MSKSSTNLNESEFAEVMVTEEMIYAGLDMFAETKGMQPGERIAYVYAAMEAVRQFMLTPPESETRH